MSGKPADSASKCCRRVGADARPNWHEVARQARLQAITRFLAGKKSPVARADEALGEIALGQGDATPPRNLLPRHDERSVRGKVSRRPRAPSQHAGASASAMTSLFPGIAMRGPGVMLGPRYCQALRPLRCPHGLRLPLFQYSERNYFRRRRIFRDICLRWLLQEQFAFTNHNRWPSFLA
jgi:hypothetical protein